MAIVGRTTWEVMNAKKALKVEWEPFSDYTIQSSRNFGGPASAVTIPAGLESTTGHKAKIAEMKTKPGNVLRKDGDRRQPLKMQQE